MEAGVIVCFYMTEYWNKRFSIFYIDAKVKYTDLGFLGSLFIDFV